MRHYLAMGTAFRDETRYLKEWIEYHRIIGATKLYMVNHDKGAEREASSAVLSPYVRSGLVCELFLDSDSPMWQYLAWKLVTDAAVGETEWICLTDADAFLFPVRNTSAITELREFERPNVAGLAIYTCTFGSSGLLLPPLLQTQSFTRRAAIDDPSNWTANYILRLHNCEPTTHDRYAAPRAEFEIFDTDGVPIAGLPKKRNGPKDKLRLNHYSIRSEEDWKKKVARGWPEAAITWTDPNRTVAEHKRSMLDKNEVLDDSMIRFSAHLREVMSYE